MRGEDRVEDSCGRPEDANLKAPGESKRRGPSESTAGTAVGAVGALVLRDQSHARATTSQGASTRVTVATTPLPVTRRFLICDDLELGLVLTFSSSFLLDNPHDLELLAVLSSTYFSIVFLVGFRLAWDPGLCAGNRCNSARAPTWHL